MCIRDRAGISKAALGKFGGQVHCFMSDGDVADEAKARGVTRAAVSMEKAASLKNPLIFAIGNAPTALIRLSELYSEGLLSPVGVIGVPVGFVNVVESKELLMETGIPCIVDVYKRQGFPPVRKGGCRARLCFPRYNVRASLSRNLFCGCPVNAMV